jgi:pilus assembly protein TadC
MLQALKSSNTLSISVREFSVAVGTMEAQETRSALSSAGKMRMKFSLFVGTGLMPVAFWWCPTNSIDQTPHPIPIKGTGLHGV